MLQYYFHGIRQQVLNGFEHHNTIYLLPYSSVDVQDPHVLVVISLAVCATHDQQKCVLLSLKITDIDYTSFMPPSCLWFISVNLQFTPML